MICRYAAPVSDSWGSFEYAWLWKDIGNEDRLSIEGDDFDVPVDEYRYLHSGWSRAYIRQVRRSEKGLEMPTPTCGVHLILWDPLHVIQAISQPQSTIQSRCDKNPRETRRKVVPTFCEKLIVFLARRHVLVWAGYGNIQNVIQGGYSMLFAYRFTNFGLLRFPETRKTQKNPETKWTVCWCSSEAWDLFTTLSLLFCHKWHKDEYRAPSPGISCKSHTETYARWGAAGLVKGKR